MTKTIIKELADYQDPGRIFTQFANEPFAVFLDSSLENANGQFCIIGLHPYEILEETNGICKRNGIEQSESIENALQALLLTNQEEATLSIPFLSGAVGYFSYDYGKKFEQIPQRHVTKVPLPDALFILYDHYIIADLIQKKLYLTAREQTCSADHAFLKIEKEIAASRKQSAKFETKHTELAPFTADFTKEDYKVAVDRMISYIIEGDLYIGNMTQQLKIYSQKDPYKVYQYLRNYHPTPFAAYFNHKDFQIVCGSMERFLQIQDKKVTTIPIKGTRKRGKTPKEDRLLKKELEDSEKDHSELLMIVDLERNDFSRICKPGSIHVKNPFQVDSYATVFHLSSVVEGLLADDLTCADVIPAVFPGGSITGAPKIRAMEIIDELEHNRRGLYTGSIGYFSFTGNCDFNIVIRTAVHQNGCYYTGVGGGITCESDLEFEYEETLQKAKALLEAAWEGESHA